MGERELDANHLVDPLHPPLLLLLPLHLGPLLLLHLFLLLLRQGMGHKEGESSGVHTIRRRGRHGWSSHRRHRGSHVTDRDCPSRRLGHLLKRLRVPEVAVFLSP